MKVVSSSPRMEHTCGWDSASPIAQDLFMYLSVQFLYVQFAVAMSLIFCLTRLVAAAKTFHQYWLVY